MHSTPAQEPSLREILWLCLPALLLGFALRAALMAYMPLAFFSPDTNEFFASHLFGGSRTFLPKLIYGTPVRLGIPLLPFIAFVQHFMGLVTVFVSGCLCAQWLQRWRWWIIPFTCLIAIHPTFLWYEHFALPDSMFLLTLMLVCLAGLHFHQKSAARSFWLLFAALFLAAGARQEGFIFLVFGLALVVRVFWGNWTRFRIFVPLAVVLSLVTAKLSRTNQGGYMLLTSLIQWAPDKLWSEPGLSARIVTLREHFKPLWPAYPDDHNTSRKLVVAAVEEYLQTERGVREKEVRNKCDAVCQKMALEIALRNFWRLPGLAFNKFRAMHEEPPSPDFGPDRTHGKQLVILFGKPGERLPKENKLMKLYLGRDYSSMSELEKDLPRIYKLFPGDILSRFQKSFYRWEYGVHLLPATQVGPQTLPGLPLLYLLAIAGYVAVAFREGFSLSGKQLWMAMLLLQAFVTFLSGSVHARYRLSFEPWFLLGVFCFLDSVVWMVKASGLLPPRPTPAPVADRPNSGTAQT